MITLDNERYLTFRESAALLNISLLTLRRWIDAGKLKTHKISARKIFVKESDIRGMFK
jgi:excisionase family DNA binding protein